MWLPSKIAKQRAAKRRTGVGAEIDSRPMLGAMTLLLIIVMLVAGHNPHCSVYGDLPLTTSASAQPKAMREDALKVVVARDGSIYFRNMKIGLEELPEMARQAVKEGAERKVYLAVDTRAKFGDVKVVSDAIAESGVRDICLLAEKAAPR